MDIHESHKNKARNRTWDNDLPLASCEAGNIFYVFVNGDTTVCPYLVFAAKTLNSKHDPREFITGNILTYSNIVEKLDKYDIYKKYQIGNNSTCNSCSMSSECGKGCPAAVIASGGKNEEVDKEKRFCNH